jgi:two-component system nitrate/nitrite response regulator NarL
LTVSAPIQLILIDDNPTFLNVAVHYLQRQANVNVLAAVPQVSAALALLQSQKPDLILLDLDLAEMSGLDAIPQFHQIDPSLAIIILSVLDSASDQRAAQQAGAACFVSKQNIHTELMPAIQRFGAERAMAFSTG